MSVEAAARERMVELGRSLHQRGLTPGNSGNLSVRVDDRVLVTPTGSCLGRLDPAEVAVVDDRGRPTSGATPSKEAGLHLAVYQQRSGAGAVVHLHSPAAVAVACLADVDPDDVLPPLTAYYALRVGRLPLAPYAPPGSEELVAAVAALAGEHHAVLLANHGPVVAGATLDAAVDAIEELEATAHLHLLLAGRPVRALTADQVAALRARP